MSNQLATPLRRRILATGLALAAFALAGCSGEQKGTQPATTATNQKLVIKVGHAATESNTGHKGLVEFNRLLGEKTGGRISLESTPGWGSTFTVVLPGGHAASGVESRTEAA